ncbi:potassium-transporting ATPase [Mycobacterium sp. DL440]|nr:potassium-transporting ATPase [Mycobacterium sp. DL440]
MSSNGDGMPVLLYLVLTVAIFALLGLVQKLVEGL